MVFVSLFSYFFLFKVFHPHPSFLLCWPYSCIVSLIYIRLSVTKFAYFSLFSHLALSDSLPPNGLQHVRSPCPSPSPKVCPSSSPLHQWSFSLLLLSYLADISLLYISLVIGNRRHFQIDVSNLCTGEGNGNPLQCSCLENPMDGGAWWATVGGVTKSWTWLSN